MRPRLADGVRLTRDRARQRDVLLGPEMVVRLNPSAFRVLSLCDGARSLEAIVSELSAEVGEDVGNDVRSVLGRLAQRGLVSGAPLIEDAPGDGGGPRKSELEPPEVLLAELTHRCPLRCGYCSNPTELAPRDAELSTDVWLEVLEQAAALGVLQVSFTGGEPLLRRDLEALVSAARRGGMYCNLITSARGLTPERLDSLAEAGLEHVQISFQDADEEAADAIAGIPVHGAKLRAARDVRERGLALSINVVLHRANIERTAELIALAESLDAGRIELAATRYHGWALRHREHLLPSEETARRSATIAADAGRRLAGRLRVISVAPDYFGGKLGACMGGWARRYMTIAPDGTALPCLGAHALPLAFGNVRRSTLASIWYDDAAFAAYRGAAWMKEPCRSCDRREVDLGGCRCQAFALTGDGANPDPACDRVDAHAVVRQAPRAVVALRRHRGGPALPGTEAL